MIEPGIEISIKRQCELLGINRSRVYYDKVMRPDRYEKIKVEVKRIWEGMPSRGARFIVRELFEIGYRPGRKKAGELMRLLGLSALFVMIMLMDILSVDLEHLLENFHCHLRELGQESFVRRFCLIDTRGTLMSG